MMQLPDKLLTAIGHYLDGTASPEEVQMVQKWYHSFNDEAVDVPVNIIELRTKVAERIWNRLENTVQANDEQELFASIPWYRRTWVRVAAALLILLAGAYVFWEKDANENSSTNTVVAPVADIEPGGDKAVLTLADGTQIVLDSVADGLLSQQGNTRVVKMNDGQLNYDSRDKAGSGEILYNTMRTPRGGQYRLTLSDGTEVWLNAASSIRYPTQFTGTVRIVEITGEVYFKVNRNMNSSTGARNPFRVIINGSAAGNGPDNPAIEVYGTQFNVMAYGDESLIKTSLLEGKIKMVQGNSQSLLQPGQQAQMNSEGKISVVEQADMDEATAWIHGLFQFKETDIKTLMRQLARWYDIDVVYEGKIPSMLITGKAPRNISLNSMLKILELSDVHYRIEASPDDPVGRGRKLVVMP